MNTKSRLLYMLIACALLTCMVQLAVATRDPRCGKEGQSLAAQFTENVIGCPNNGCFWIRRDNARDCGLPNPAYYAYCSMTTQYGYGSCWNQEGDGYTKEGICSQEPDGYTCINWQNSEEHRLLYVSAQIPCSEGYDAEYLCPEH